MDLSALTIGFLGCGKISSAVARGYASFSTPPRRILVSPRSQSKAEALRADFPGLIEIAENEAIAAESDVLFIGLLPGTANEILPTLSFKDNQLVRASNSATQFFVCF
jgi:pyrroline-5-carboxylate reductase